MKRLTPDRNPTTGQLSQNPDRSATGQLSQNPDRLEPARKRPRQDEGLATVATVIDLLLKQGSTLSNVCSDLLPQAAQEHKAACHPTHSKWSAIAASRRVDLFWRHLDAIRGRAQDIKSYYGALNNLLCQTMPVGQPMIDAMNLLSHDATTSTSFSGLLVVPQVERSLHFGSQNRQVWNLAKELFLDKEEVWDLLLDQENSRRKTRNDPKRPGKLMHVDYVRVNIGPLNPPPEVAACGEFLGVRFRMDPPSSASKAACTGSLAIRLRRKKRESLPADQCFHFAFRTPPEARDMPVSFVIYHNQTRMERDSRDVTDPLKPMEGVVLVPDGTGNYRKEWVAYYDLLWLYSSASYDGSFFKFQPEDLAQTFHQLTGGTWTATADVIFQRQKKPEHATKVWRAYVARRRSYGFRSYLTRIDLTVPDRVSAGPSFVPELDPPPEPITIDKLTDDILQSLPPGYLQNVTFDYDLEQLLQEPEPPAVMLG